jgi:polyhydroxybutyrate depolymerase
MAIPAQFPQRCVINPWTRSPKCFAGTRPVSVLHIHGTADQIILFEGGANSGRAYPSAAATIDLWRRHNGCAGQADTSATPIDLDSKVPGRRPPWRPTPPAAATAAGWRCGPSKDGGHIPGLTASFAPAVIDFLLARSRP